MAPSKTQFGPKPQGRSTQRIMEVPLKLSTLNTNASTETREVGGVQDVANIVSDISLHMWSPATFKDNHAKNENFQATELLVFDFDNTPDGPQLSLDQAKRAFAEYKCIIATTRNHQREKTSGSVLYPAADRFRVVLFLSKPITDSATYSATWRKMQNMWPAMDKACKDPARRYYPCRDLIVVNNNGHLIEPTAPVLIATPGSLSTGADFAYQPGPPYGVLSRTTQRFMEEGTRPWNNNLFKAAKDHQEQGYSQEQFVEKATAITGYLEPSSLATVASAYRNPPRYPKRMPRAESAVETWTRDWLLNHGARISYGTGKLYVDGQAQPADLVFSRIVLDSKTYAEQNPIITENGKKLARKTFAEKDIEHVLGLWMGEQKNEALDEYRAGLAFCPTYSQDGIAAFVKAVTGDAHEHDVAVLTHFIWQVKRKLAGLPVEWHMMPIFHGKTGGGKTVAIEKLMQPVLELSYQPSSMKVMDDERQAALFGKYFVIFFDEMGKAETVDVNCLKNKITSPTVSYRKLGTNLHSTLDNTATFIGASNKEVRDIIHDPTSARRFWQVSCMDILDHATINSIDYNALWKSVDETRASPVLPFQKRIADRQDADFRAKSYVELWLDEAMVVDVNTWNAGAELFVWFQDWCEDQKIRSSMTRDYFCRQVKGLGVPNKRTAATRLYGVKPAPKQVISLMHRPVKQ